MRRLPGGPASKARSRLALVLALVVAASLVAIAPVSAAHPEASLTGSNFEIDEDANLKLDDASPSVDWGSLAHPNGPELRQTDQPTGQDDDSYKGGVKEDTECPGEVTGSIPNNKSDLLTFHVYEEPGVGTHPGFVNLAWSRVSDPSGTTLMDFEFNQSSTQCTVGPNVTRTAGDLLIEYAIDQGGSRAEISGRFWTGTEWGAPIDLDDGTGCGGSPCATGTINTSVIPSGESDGLGEKQARTFGEAQIDLRLIFDDQSCVSFGSAMLKSRSSDAFTSQLKDFISPIPIDINNCGQVIIRKQTDPDGATESFGYTKAFPTDPATSNTFSLSDDGVQDYGQTVLFGSGYTVDEDTIATGFDLVAIDCSASTGVTPSVNVLNGTVTFDINSDGDVLDCTYTNRARATIVVEKITDDGFGSFDFTSSTLSPSPFTLTTSVAGAGGKDSRTFSDLTPGTIVVEKITDDGSGSFDFTSGTLSPSSFTLTTSVAGAGGKDSRTFSDLTPGTYDVAETVPAGWDLVSATCDDGSDPASIGLGAGETVTCTFHDAREKGAIEITKTRKYADDGPGNHPHPGVTFTITGGELPAGVVVVTDDNGKACVDGLVLSSFVGSYTVTETVPAGYAADEATAKSVSVTAKSTCGDGSEADIGFSNTPLTDVSVNVTSQDPDATKSSIECVAADDTVVGGDGASFDDPASLDIEGLLPGTYTCTIVIDP